MTQRTAMGLALVLIVAVVAVLALALRTEGPAAVPAPTATATATAAPTTTAAAALPTPTTTPASTTSPTPTAVASVALCDAYQPGDTPIVAPRLSGRWLRVALDAVRPGQGGRNRWAVRFMLAGNAPSNAEIPPSVTVTGPNGPLQVFRYSAGPPNAGDGAMTQPITLAPCGRPEGGAVVLIVETTGVTSGTYTIVVRDVRRPEGDRSDESWTVKLTCAPDPGPATPPATNCR